MPVNIPRILSLYRLAAAPVALLLALGGYRDAFFIIIIISLITDLIDGPLARWSGQETSFGAKLDTIADACTLLVGIFGVFIFQFDDMKTELPWLYFFLASYAFAAIASLMKFGGLPAYHLYLSKLAAACAALFFVWLYFFGYSREFFIVVVSIGLLANAESLLLTLHLRNRRTDIRSVLAVMSFSRSEED